MPNKFINAAIATLKRREDIKDFPAFWDAIGRPDLRDAPGDRLALAPLLQSIRHRAAAIIAARNGEEPEAAKRPAPLTSFLRLGRDGRTRYYHLRPTKGWVGGVVDEYEIKAYEKQGVKVLADFPPGRAFDRARRRS